MVYLIGGGLLNEMSDINNKIALELEHIRVEQGRKPIILFLPQASSESKPYVNSFYKEFGSRLKCKAVCALWKNEEMCYEHIAEKFAKCDAIYIGGGRYDVLVTEFAKMGIENLLRDCYHQGKLIVGNSAGAMILCKESISDYKKVVNKDADYEVVKGYAIVDDKLCPHSNEYARKDFIVANDLKNYHSIAEKEYIVIG